MLEVRARDRPRDYDGQLMDARVLAAVDQCAACLADHARRRGIDLRSRTLGFGLGLLLDVASRAVDEGAMPQEIVRELHLVVLAIAVASQDDGAVEWVRRLMAERGLT